jgi:hypothetical protein
MTTTGMKARRKGPTAEEHVMDDPADKVDLATMLAAQLAQRDEEHRKREAEGIRIIAGAIISLRKAGFDSVEISRLLRLVVSEIEGRDFVD